MIEKLEPIASPTGAAVNSLALSSREHLLGRGPVVLYEEYLL